MYLQSFKEHLAGQIYAPRQGRQTGTAYCLRKERGGVREEAEGDDKGSTTTIKTVKMKSCFDFDVLLEQIKAKA